MKSALYPLIVGATAIIFAAVHTVYLHLRPYWTDDLWSTPAQIGQWTVCIVVSGAAFWAMVLRVQR